MNAFYFIDTEYLVGGGEGVGVMSKVYVWYMIIRERNEGDE